MRTLLFVTALLSIVVLGLVSCTQGPVTTLHKTGTSVEQRVSAADACKIASFRKIPQMLVTETTPGYSRPSTTTCNTENGITACETIDGISVAPTVSTYDQNDELRQRYVVRCLQSKGYQRIVKPICKTDSENAAARLAEQNQPPADEIYCIRKYARAPSGQ